MSGSPGPFVGAVALVVIVALIGSAWRRLFAVFGEGRVGVGAAATLATMAVVDGPAALTGGLQSGLLVMAFVVMVAAAAVRALALPGPATALRTAPSWTMGEYLVGAVVLGLLGWCAVTTWMWDEQSTHLPLAGAAARGVLPLEHPAFPGQPLRYHAGYAMVVGVVRAFTALPIDVCADVVTVAGVVALVVALRDVLRLLGATGRGAALGLVVVLCMGGPLAGLLADGWGAGLPGKGVLPAAWVNGATFPPLVVTNVLQHPQGLAMPIALAVVMLLVDRRHRPLARVLLAAILVVALARIQILFSAFSGLLLAATVAIDLWRRRPLTAHDRRGAAVTIVVVVVAGVLAGAVGGIGAGGASALVWGAGYFAADGAAAIVHELLAFGLSMLALPAAVWLVRRNRSHVDVNDMLLLCALLGVFGLLVGNVATYSRSWDIVKFFGVGFFFGHLPLAVALGRLPPRVAVVVVIISCWSGAFWLLRHGPLQGVVAPVSRERSIDAFAVGVDDACGDVVAGHARVLSTKRSLWQAGWLVPGSDWRSNRDMSALLLDRPRVDADLAAWTRAARTLDEDALRDLGVEVVVVDEASLVRLDGPLHSGRFRERCRAPGAIVFEVVAMVAP